MRKPKIAIIGARGVGNYGGFETVVAEIGPRLSKQGFDVYCSCEKNEENGPEDYNGIKLIYFPFMPPCNYTLRKVYEIIYDLYFTIKCGREYDIVYALGLGNASLAFYPRIWGKASVANVDGVEWKRSKFGIAERKVIKIFFLLDCLWANNLIIDNEHLKIYIESDHQKKTVFIPYGVREIPKQPWASMEFTDYLFTGKVDKPTNGKYWLIVARLEPENNIHMMIEAFARAKGKYPLVLIGSFTSDVYKEKIRKIIEENNVTNTMFLGSIYDQKILNMLRQNCLGYLHGHSVGGTNPSLLEAMMCENIILAHDNEFNREVGAKSLLYFKDEVELMRTILDIEKDTRPYQPFKIESKNRVIKDYNWDVVVELYLTLFRELLRREAV